MGDEEAFDLEHIAPLDADTIPNANQSHSCFSCGENMNGVFCYACGNKNDNYRRSIWALGAELFSSLTAFEGRIWRSFRSLIFKPGQMAREFSDGARQKWTSPIRLYLATSLLLFGYVALSQTQLVAFGTKSDPNAIFQAGAEGKQFTSKMFFLKRKSTISETVSDDVISAFEKDMVSIINDDDDKSLEALELDLVGIQTSLESINAQIEDTKFRYAKAGLETARTAITERIESLEIIIQKRKEDIPNGVAARSSAEDPSGVDEPAELNETKTDPTEGDENKADQADEADKETDGTTMDIVGMNGEKFTLDSEGMRKAVSIALRQPERINAPVNKYLPRIMFLMMPFSMLMGAIFIRGREKAMLFDHLVHAAYIHAFSFLLLFVFILLTQFTPIKGLLWIYSAILLIYLPISAKRMFGRGWFKTLLTSYGVGTIYTFNMMIILTFLMGIGLFDIASDVAVRSPS